MRFIRLLVWLFGIQSAVAAIVVKGGKVLLTRRAKYLIDGGKWCLPGGGMEKWETSLVSIKRELKEETGLNSREIKLLFVHEEFVRRLKIHANVFVYEIKPYGKFNQNWEVSEYKWFSKSEINKLDMAFTHKYILNKYFGLKVNDEK